MDITALEGLTFMLRYILGISLP